MFCHPELDSGSTVRFPLSREWHRIARERTPRVLCYTINY